ncbi:MAG: glycerol kinase GlpK [Elusimicrobiota bacterium]
MNTKVVLAIDLGTTGNRVMAFSREGKILAKAYYEFPQIFPKPGWVEHNPLDILKTTLKALRDAAKAVGVNKIVSIGITNQRETTILWDKFTGQPVYNAIVWQCRRTEDICRNLKQYSKVIKGKTGLVLDPYFSASKIKWLLKNVSGLREKIFRGRILFGTPETWILWNLTGGKVHCTEPSNASRTMLFNLRTLEFDRELLKIFALPGSILPEIKDSDSTFGVLAKNILGKEIPLVGILGDQQASLFTQCGEEKGTIKATYGTGIFVMTNIGKKPVISDKLLTTIAWKVGKEVNYALEGSLFMGGATIQWLRDNLKILKSAADSEQMAAALKDNEGVYFVPAFQGLGAPYWDPEARGLLIGLTRKTTTKNIARAALESLAYQTRDVIEEMEKNLQYKFKVLRVDGGATLNNFLMQFQTDILSLPVERLVNADSTALGAAGISAIATGFWSKEAFKKMRKIDKVFRPKMPSKNSDLYYAKWQEAVKRSLKWK